MSKDTSLFSHCRRRNHQYSILQQARSNNFRELVSLAQVQITCACSYSKVLTWHNFWFKLISKKNLQNMYSLTPEAGDNACWKRYRWIFIKNILNHILRPLLVFTSFGASCYDYNNNNNSQCGSRFRGVWGDPAVGNLTPTGISTHREVDSLRPTK